MTLYFALKLKTAAATEKSRNFGWSYKRFLNFTFLFK